MAEHTCTCNQLLYICVDIIIEDMCDIEPPGFALSIYHFTVYTIYYQLVILVHCINVNCCTAHHMTGNWHQLYIYMWCVAILQPL